MKKYLLLMLISIVAVGTASAQRYLPGQKGLQFTAGVSDGFQLKNGEGQAIHAGMAVSVYNKKGNRWVYGAELWQRKYQYKNILLPASQITAEGGYYLNFLSSPSKTFFLSLGGSVLVGYETLNWGKHELSDGSTIAAKDSFIYGGALTLELETFLSDKVILLINASERCMWGSAVKKFHFQAGIGFKFLIN